MYKPKGVQLGSLGGRREGEFKLLGDVGVGLGCGCPNTYS